jgi:hypothetical protein
MSTDDYDDSEGPEDNRTWRCICIVAGIFLVTALAIMAAALLGAF